MSTLTLTVLRCPGSVVAEQRQLQGGELTIGRGTECGWPLSDPLKSLSRRHCTIEYTSGSWQVRDLSVNGTYTNFSTKPIGRDAVQVLHHGDRLRLGDYEIEVQIDQTILVPSSAIRQGGMAPGGLDEPVRPSFGAAPLPGLDNPVGVRGGFGAPGRAPEPLAYPDHVASVSEAFEPPRVVPAGMGAIPEDWNAPAVAKPVAPAVTRRVEPVPSAFAELPAEVSRSSATLPPGRNMVQPAQNSVAPRRASVAPPVSTPVADDSMVAALAAFMAGGDLPPEALGRASADPDAALRNAGALLRAAVAGIRALLIARGEVKREFRIEQTVLRPDYNNPMKFASSDEQALAALLDPRTPAPLRAVQESVQDLSLHQVAALAATQAAARALMERLGPAELEAEDTGGGLMPGAREKRLWESYKRRHAKLLEQFEDDFDGAFGTAFARAYEQAARRAKG